MDFKEELIKFLNTIKEKEDYKELLSSAFELSFRLNEDDIETTLNNIIFEIFKINGNIFLEYLCLFENFTNNELDFEDNDVVTFINEIKLKYGYFVRISRNKMRAPFAIKDIQGNIGQGFSHSTLTITRNDGESLTLSCTCQDLVNILISVNDMISNNISLGVYNLNLNSLKILLDKSKEVNNTVEEIINGNLQ